MRVQDSLSGLVKAAAVVGCVAWSFYTRLISDFLYYPREPNPAAGRIVAYVTKGITVYISPSEDKQAAWLFWIAVLAAGFVIAVTVVKGREWLKRRRQ